MTELLVARVDNVIKGTDGVMHRVHRGRTIAEPGHPVVKAAPQAFMPFEIHLPAPDGGTDDEVMAQVTEETAELRAELDNLIQLLTTISDGLEVRGLLDGVNREKPGWIVEAVFAALDRRAPGAEPVAPPAPTARKTAPRKSAGRQAAPDGA